MSADHRPTEEQRSQSLNRLGAALTTGELDLSNYERRTELARSTTSAAELATVTADLAIDPEDTRRTELREWLDEWRWWLGGVIVLVGTWAVQSASTGELKTFWPGVPLGIWALILIAVTMLPRERD